MIIMSRVDKYIQWDQRDRGSSIPSEKREKILWESVSACAEIVLHSLYFSQTNREVEKEVEKEVQKEVVEEVEKKFELSLAVFLDSMEKIQSLLIEGKESKVKKEGKEVVFILFDRYLSLPSLPPSSTTVVEKEVVEEVEIGGSKLILSPEWLKLVSLTVRTVLSWCTLLMQSECETSASLPLSSPVHTLPPSSSVTTTTPTPTTTTTAAAAAAATTTTVAAAVSEDDTTTVTPTPESLSVSVPVCVKDGMRRARQLLIQLIGKYASRAHECTYMHACYK